MAAVLNQIKKQKMNKTAIFGKPCLPSFAKAKEVRIERNVLIYEYCHIAIPQTIQIGTRKIVLERFSGIIGGAFHKLYIATIPEKSVIH